MRGFLTFLSFLSIMSVSAQNPTFYLLIGTYTKAPSKSEGVYVYKFNPNRGEATLVSKTAADNPSYLAITKDQKYVYAVNEVGDDNGKVSAFGFDKQKGELRFINKQPSGGDNPAYISVDSTGKWVVTANYSGGNVTILSYNRRRCIGAFCAGIGTRRIRCQCTAAGTTTSAFGRFFSRREICVCARPWQRQYIFLPF